MIFLSNFFNADLRNPSCDFCRTFEECGDYVVLCGTIRRLLISTTVQYIVGVGFGMLMVLAFPVH